MLRIASTREAMLAGPKIDEILADFPHSSSFRAILAMAAGGTDLERIEAAAALRRTWMERPDLRLTRSWNRMERRVDIRSGSAGSRQMLGWRCAAGLIALAGDGDLAAASLETDWREAWIGLDQHASEWTCFANYLRLLSNHTMLKALPDSRDQDDWSHDARCRPLRPGLVAAMSQEPRPRRHLADLREIRP